jgi:hypothetical protein
MQSLVAAGYVLAKREHMLVPRVLGTVCWLIAGYLLFLVGKRLSPPAAALIAVGYFLLVPFGVVASQSFQPNPLMMAWLVAALHQILRSTAGTGRNATLWAGVTAGIAVLIKPVCVFSIAFLYVAVVLYQTGLRGLLRSPRPWVVGFLTALPSAIWYLPRLFGEGRLGGQAEQSFRPELFATHEYWSGWLRNLVEVAPTPYVLGASLLGLALARRGLMRVVLWALWLGYLAYGLTFNYHISTHNYYQLPGYPVIALSLASLSDRLLGLPRGRVRLGMRLVVGLAVVALAGLFWDETRASIWPQSHTVPDADPRGYVEIGELVQHSPKVVFVTPNSYGGPLEFRAELSGWYWPSTADFRRARRRKRPPFDWQGRFNELLQQGAEYFVSTPADELTQQRAIGELLRSRYKLISSSDKYLVYDLRSPL